MFLFFLLQHGHACLKAEGFELRPVAALDAFQRPGDVVDAGWVHRAFELGALLEIALGFVRTAQFQQVQAAEVVGAGILRMAVDGLREKLMGLDVVPAEIGVYAVAVQLAEDRVLCRQGHRTKQNQTGDCEEQTRLELKSDRCVRAMILSHTTVSKRNTSRHSAPTPTE